MLPRIKVCGILDVVEAWMAIARGAHLLGLDADFLDGDELAALTDSTPPGVTPVIVTARTDPADLITLQKATGAPALQLRRPVAPQAYGALYSAIPGLKLIQQVAPFGREQIEDVLALSRQVDCLWLHLPQQPNWPALREVLADSACPVFLGGPIPLQELAAVHRQGQPFGFDLDDAVRSHARLDEGKLRQAIDALS